ncbi:general odorant-binding protein 19d-like, partial [Ctenocephalides felis]
DESAKEDAKAAVQELVKKCAKETGATEEEIKELKTKVPLESKGAKCFGACLYRNFGVFKDGKYNPEALVAASKMFYDETTPQHEKIKEIAQECAKEVVDADECELAAKAVACESPKFKENNIDIPL